MTNKHNILIIDDEPDILKLLELSITRMGFLCSSAPNVNEALELLANGTFSLCITDKNLPDGDGLEIIRYIQENKAELPVAMITAYGNLDTAIEAMKAGAFDYITKPIDFKNLEQLILSAIKSTEIEIQKQADDKYQIIGNSAAISLLKQKILKVAKSQAPVFIHGESGSGKELVARTIHSQSSRYDGPFIAVNCGAIPSELVESELFGHKKGSFTGATEDKQGFFHAANGGTLFLDEVADLPLAMQVKLLRAIQEKAVRAVGDASEKPVDVRILSASHKDLPTEINNGNFREDLYYRINVIDLSVPPLRERKEDIPELTNHIINKLAQRYNLPNLDIDEEAQSQLINFDFPGNVRELENIVERAITLCENGVIRTQDLSFPKKANAVIKPSKLDVVQGESQVTTSHDPKDALGDLEGYLAQIEKEALEYALEKAKWNKTAAAELLGISFRTMRYKLKKYSIE